jgi:hypothetical protein
MESFGTTSPSKQDFVNDMWVGCALTAYQQALQVGREKDRDFIRTLAYHYFDNGMKSLNEELNGKEQRCGKETETITHKKT